MTLAIAFLQFDGPTPPLPGGIVELARIGPVRVIGKETTILSNSGRAILVGHAFRRETYEPCSVLDADAAEKIVESEGAWAIRSLWGNYILAWVAGEEQVFILRAPLTGPAIFCASKVGSGAPGTAHCAFTDLGLARALGFALDRPDAGAIDAYLRYPLLRAPRAGIEGVVEILPGEISRLDRPGRRPASWLPWDYATEPPARADPAELAGIVRNCVRAWSDRFARIQLELSGGIDSSIVAVCLADRTDPWRALTMVTAEPDGDERPYARAVTDGIGAPLAELMLSPEPADPIPPAAALRVRPGGFGLIAPTDLALLASAREFGADAIFSGTAGDGAFGYQTSIAPALDAFHYRGLRAAYSAARDQARIMDDNIWSALRHGLRGYIRGIRHWPVDEHLLSRRHASPRPDHPWFDDAERFPPGIRRYGLGILPIQPFLDGYGRSQHLPKIAPLLAQPLIEYGLGVPSWQWGEGGVNRSLARDAFRAELPEIVLNRRSKGRILSMFLPAFEQNRSRLAGHLLDGWLAGAGLLDVDAIGAKLSGRERADTTDILRVLQFADIEGWARSVAGDRSFAW